MKTKGALLWELNSPLRVDEIDVDDPVADEVQIRLHAAGMCHSDYHLVDGNTPMMLPALTTAAFVGLGPPGDDHRHPDALDYR
jgi:S-(hydroxymethyl)glutathione dehydrogenase/alcohol dehydrogenase